MKREKRQLKEQVLGKMNYMHIIISIYILMYRRKYVNVYTYL